MREIITRPAGGGNITLIDKKKGDLIIPLHLISQFCKNLPESMHFGHLFLAFSVVRISLHPALHIPC